MMTWKRKYQGIRLALALMIGAVPFFAQAPAAADVLSFIPLAQMGHDHDGDGIPDHGPQAHQKEASEPTNPWDAVVLPAIAIVGGVGYILYQKARRKPQEG